MTATGRIVLLVATVGLVAGTTAPTALAAPSASPSPSASATASPSPSATATDLDDSEEDTPSGIIAATPSPSAPGLAYEAKDFVPGSANSQVALTAISGSTAATDIVVPPGLVPDHFTGELSAPISLSGQDVLPGSLDVYAGTRLVSHVDAEQGLFWGNLRPSDVDADGILTISIRYSVVQDPGTDDLCRDTRQSITMSNIAIAYEGTQLRPETIAEFVAPGVRAANVVVTGTTSANRDDLTQAGLAAVGALAYRFGSTVPVIMTFDEPDPALTAVAGSRVVVIAPGFAPTTTSITIVDDVPTLTITGEGDALSEAASALGSDNLPLAGAADTTGLTQTGQEPGASTVTLADLGAARPSLSGWGSNSLYVGVKQSDFQGPISGAQVHLSGTHTSVPESVAASVNVYWNGFLIASQTLGPEVPFQLTADVPDSVLTPSNGIQVTLTSVPSAGDTDSCGSALSSLPMELFLDGTQSTITAGRGQTIDAGFERFPQTLAGALPIAFGTGSSFTDAAIQAAYLTASLQVANATQLVVSLNPLDALESQSVSGVITGAGEADSNTLESPLRLTSFRTVESTSVNFGVGVTLPYAALEAFEQNGRNLLLLGSWSPSTDQDELARETALHLAQYTYGVVGGWASLSGNILLGQPGVDPVSLTTNAVAVQTVVSSEYRPIAWWVLGIFLLLLVIGLLRMWTARRARRKLKAYVDAQEQADREGASRSAAYQARLAASAEADDVTGPREGD